MEWSCLMRRTRSSSVTALPKSSWVYVWRPTVACRWSTWFGCRNSWPILRPAVTTPLELTLERGQPRMLAVHILPYAGARRLMQIRDVTW